MVTEYLKALFTLTLLAQIAAVLVPFALVLGAFMALRHWRAQRTIVQFVVDGLWCSTHQTINAGVTSNFFDSDLFLAAPANIDLALKWFVEELERQRSLTGKVDRLVFIEREDGPVGAITLKDLLSWKTRVPAAIVRPWRKGPALKIKILHSGAGSGESYLPTFRSNGRSETVVLINDVSTTGKTIMHSLNMIQEAGGNVVAALILYDRSEDITKDGEIITAKEKLRHSGIRLASMVQASDLSGAIGNDKEVRSIAIRKGIVKADLLSESLG